MSFTEHVVVSQGSGRDDGYRRAEIVQVQGLRKQYEPPKGVLAVDDVMHGVWNSVIQGVFDRATTGPAALLCLALFAGGLEGDRKDRAVHGLVSDKSLARSSVYFTHYWCSPSRFSVETYNKLC